MEYSIKFHIDSLLTIVEEIKKTHSLMGQQLRHGKAGRAQALRIHIIELQKRAKRKWELIDSISHAIILSVIIDKGGRKVEKLLTNIKRDEFFTICSDNKYLGYKILEVKEIYPNEYEREVREDQGNRGPVSEGGS